MVQGELHRVSLGNFFPPVLRAVGPLEVNHHGFSLLVRGQDIDGAGYLHFGPDTVDVERGRLVEFVLGGADVHPLGLQGLEQFDDGVLDDGPEAG